MTTIRCILVPTDFSASAAHTLSTAAEFAATFGARIVLVHVIQPSAYPIRNLATISGFPNLQQELRKTIERDLADLRRKIPASIDVVTQIREGIPHDEILDCAAEHKCDLIVMATQGLTGLKHALLGSTTERVVRLSPVPVLTMRHAPD
ncbi:MAG: universal stress protein [Planctomycetota bacterium]